MKISTRTRYGIRALLELAENEGNGPLQIKAIAKDQDISIKYLEQLMYMLRSGGFVRSIRGSKGGYVLAKAPERINLLEVFNCLEGKFVAVECLEDKSLCSRADGCVTRELWLEVQNAVREELGSVTLADLVGRKRDVKTEVDVQR